MGVVWVYGLIMGVVWVYFHGNTSTNDQLKFKRMAKITMVTLILPHSRAAEERVLSMVVGHREHTDCYEAVGSRLMPQCPSSLPKRVLIQYNV